MAAGLAVVASRSPRYLVAYLARDLGTLSPEAREARLMQIASIGKSGLPVIVDQFATGKAEISRICERILGESQNAWTTLPIEKRLKHHRILLDRLSQRIAASPPTRYVSISHMVRQSMQDLATREEPEAIALRSEMAALVGQLGDQNPAAIASQTGNVGDSTTLMASRRPMVVASGASASGTWTQWPPDAEDADSLLRSRQRFRAIEAIDASTFGTVASSDSPPPAESDASVGLKKVTDTAAIVLRPAPRQSTPLPGASTRLPVPVQQQILPVSGQRSEPPMPEVPPMAALADVSVFGYLHSDDGKIRSAAEMELRSRRYSDGALQLARIVGSPDPSDRVALATQLPRMSQMDPRPWLAWLCSDTDRTVRMQAISVVASFNDSDAKSLLRRQLSVETDSQISKKIRRFLDL